MTIWVCGGLGGVDDVDDTDDDDSRYGLDEDGHSEVESVTVN